MAESHAVPTARAARSDPSPVSTSKTLWITRKVRVVKQIQPGGVIDVDDVKAQSSPAPFKVCKVSAWMPGRFNAEFQLGDGTWINDTSTKMTFVDVAPPGRMPGVTFDIPDQLSEIMNTGSTAVLLARPLVTTEGYPGALLVADITIRYQI